MKIFVTLTLTVLLLACSNKDGDLILSCYGTNTVTTANKTTMVDEIRKYTFVGKKLENYECEWGAKAIVCYDAKDDSETRNRNHPVYDRQSGSFTALHTIRTNIGNHLINRVIFVGHCESPIFN
jgi:hypothetical protein